MRAAQLQEAMDGIDPEHGHEKAGGSVKGAREDPGEGEQRREAEGAAVVGEVLLQVAAPENGAIFLDQADRLRMVDAGVGVKFAAGGEEGDCHSKEKDHEPFAGAENCAEARADHADFSAAEPAARGEQGEHQKVRGCADARKQTEGLRIYGEGEYTGHHAGGGAELGRARRGENFGKERECDCARRETDEQHICPENQYLNHDHSSCGCSAPQRASMTAFILPSWRIPDHALPDSHVL